MTCYCCGEPVLVPAMQIPISFEDGIGKNSGDKAVFCTPCTDRLWKACDDWDATRRSNGGNEFCGRVAG